MVGYNGTYYWVDYDEIGNPVRYGYGLSDSDYMEDGYELTWDGRELVAFRGCSDFDALTYYSEITYTYNADGIRTSKTVNGVKHEYYLSGSQIIAEVWTENGVEHMLIYIYDEVGAPIGLKYRTDEYDYDVFDCFFFEKNLQGDIVAVYNENGRWLGCYYYDAWGNHTVSTSSASTTLENKVVNLYNPFRYRGYYYDVETKFYYLQSRYYNPEWCRFLNTDNIAFLGANGDLQAFNLYAYCSNNPVMYGDVTGEFIGALVGTVVGAICGAVSGAISAAKSGGDIWFGMASGAVSGAMIGLLGSCVVDPASAVLVATVSAGIAMTNDIANQTYNYVNEEIENGNRQINVKKWIDNMDWGSVAYTGASTFTFSCIGGWIDLGVDMVFSDCTDDLCTTIAKDVVAPSIFSAMTNGGQFVADLVFAISRG